MPCCQEPPGSACMVGYLRIERPWLFVRAESGGGIRRPTAVSPWRNNTTAPVQCSEIRVAALTCLRRAIARTLCRSPSWCLLVPLHAAWSLNMPMPTRRRPSVNEPARFSGHCPHVPPSIVLTDRQRMKTHHTNERVKENPRVKENSSATRPGPFANFKLERGRRQRWFRLPK